MPKHFLPKYESDLVSHCLKGIVYENENISLLEHEKVVFNNKFDSNKVSLISGGGSGHEPGWAGFVGSGMLTAAAQGDVFASPNDKNIQAAESITHSDAGVIFIITNYTGDNLYFGMAAQDLIARYGESKVRLLRVTDDVAVGKSTGGLVGRRTLAGCTLVMKILGAASEKNYDINQIFNLGIDINKNIASINAGLDHVHIPGHRSDEDYGQLKPNQIEIGLGIHNEPGVMKINNIPSNEELIAKLLHYIFNENDPERGWFKYDKGDEIVLLFNNLGGLPNLEEKALLFTTVETLDKIYNIVPARIYSGHFITSLNAPIFTITLFNVTKSASTNFTSDQLFELLDDSTSVLCWPKNQASSSNTKKTYQDRIITNFKGYEEEKGIEYDNDIFINPTILVNIIRTAAENVIKREPEITDWDTKMGDGDCGKTLEAGCKAILKELDDDNNNFSNGSVISALHIILKVIKEDMGGTLSAILFIFMKSFINKLEILLADNSNNNDNNDNFSIALLHGIKTLSEFTKARIGHRTVMDVLIPFCNSFADSKDIITAVNVARDSAEGTRKLKPKLGRATYVGGLEDTVDFPPDPGAYGVYEIIDALRLLEA